MARSFYYYGETENNSVNWVLLWVLCLLGVMACSKPSPDTAAEAKLSALAAETAVVASDSPVKRHMEKAINLLKEGKYSESIDEFSQVIKIDAEMLDAYFGRAKAYARQGNALKEQQDYRALIDVAMQRPEHSHGEVLGNAYYSLALLVAEGADAEASLALLEKALQVSEDVGVYFHGLKAERALMDVRLLEGFTTMMAKHWSVDVEKYVPREDPRAVKLREPPRVKDIDPRLHQPPKLLAQ